MRTRLLILTMAALLPVSGCRDATDPTASDPLAKVSQDLPRQLTWSHEDDRSPTWSASGQTIFYNTPGLAPFARTPALLMEVPAVGGDAEPLFPQVQFPSGPERRFSAAVTAPGGDRVAYVELRTLNNGNVCPGAPLVSCTPAGTQSFGPHLREVVFRVRDLASTGTIAADPSFSLALAGIQQLEPGPPRLIEVDLFPFHLLFNEQRSYGFRPSWSPDGERLVFSTGRALAVWDVGSGDAPVLITDQIEAVYPAWSPDGEWIAVTRLVPGDPLFGQCTHNTFLGTACRQIRTVTPVEERRILLIRPDGSEITDLGVGEHPAWMPDSNRLVFRRGDELVMGSVNGGAVIAIPDTEGGVEPAVSPDGRFVAFARSGPGGDYDIWVTGLDGGTP